jgi:hypothetical protein
MAGLAIAVAGTELYKWQLFSSVIVIPDCYSSGKEFALSFLSTTLRPIYPLSIAMDSIRWTGIIPLVSCTFLAS